MKCRLSIFTISFLICFSSSVLGQDAKPETSVSIQPKEVKVKMGKEFSVKVEVHKITDLFGAPFYLLYDAKTLEVIKVSQGDFLKKDGKKTAFLFKTDKKSGKIIVGLTRLGPVGGINGEGTLAVIKFKALKAGRTDLSLDHVDFNNSRQASIPVRTDAAIVNVK